MDRQDGQDEQQKRICVSNLRFEVIDFRFLSSCPSCLSMLISLTSHSPNCSPAWTRMPLMKSRAFMRCLPSGCNSKTRSPVTPPQATTKSSPRLRRSSGPASRPLGLRVAVFPFKCLGPHISTPPVARRVVCSPRLKPRTRRRFRLIPRPSIKPSSRFKWGLRASLQCARGRFLHLASVSPKSPRPMRGRASNSGLSRARQSASRAQKCGPVSSPRPSAVVTPSLLAAQTPHDGRGPTIFQEDGEKRSRQPSAARAGRRGENAP